MTATDTAPIHDTPPGRSPFNDASRKAPRTGSRARSTTPLPPWREGAIAAWCTKFYTLGGRGLAKFDPLCGNSMVECADAAGHAWERVAKNNPAIRRMFAVLMQTSDFGELLLAHAPLILAALSHHGPFRSAIEHVGEEFQHEFTDILRGEQQAA